MDRSQMTADIKDPQYWRFRAEEVLTIAESLEYEETKDHVTHRRGLQAHSANGRTTARAREKIKTRPHLLTYRKNSIAGRA